HAKGRVISASALSGEQLSARARSAELIHRPSSLTKPPLLSLLQTDAPPSQQAETVLPRFLVQWRSGSLFSACRSLKCPYYGASRPGIQLALPASRGDGDGNRFRLRTADVDAVGDLRSSVFAGSAQPQRNQLQDPTRCAGFAAQLVDDLQVGHHQA